MPFSIADNLPVATRLEFYPNREAGGEEEQKKDVVKDIQFEHGYRLGFVDNNKVDILQHRPLLNTLFVLYFAIFKSRCDESYWVVCHI